MISARSTRSSSALFLYFPLFLLALAVFAAPRPAHAQLRWDASLQAGVSKRFFSGSPKVAGLGGSIGPIVGLEGDVAILPLVRLGAYVDFEYASTSEPTPPTALSFGGRVKVMIPGYRSNVHWWLFTGFGGVAVQAPGYTESGLVLPQNANTLVTLPASGYLLEVPLGVGLGWRVRKPWEVVAELQGRFGFDASGSYFTDLGSGNGLGRPTNALFTNPQGKTTPTSLNDPRPTGNDVFAVLFTVGIGLDD